jgi:branched-chain amino acid transport system permease protein
MGSSEVALPAASNRWRIAAAALAVVVLAVYPLVAPNAYLLYVAVFALMYMALATSWNIMGGLTGYISLGHSAFFGLGAYITGLAVTRGSLPHLPMAVVAGLVVGVLAIGIGYVALRVRGASFVIVTIALVYMFNLLAQGWRSLTGGSTGLRVPVIGDLSRMQVHTLFFYMFALMLVLVMATWWFIDRSKLGMGLKAIREDEDKAQALGVPTNAYKITAFAISAGFTALGGGLYASWFNALDPVFVFSIIIGANMVLMSLLGGVRHLLGPVLGAVIVVPATEYFLVQLGETQIHLVATGLLLAFVVLVMPDGIIPAIAALRRRRDPPASSIRESAAGAATPQEVTP